MNAAPRARWQSVRGLVAALLLGVVALTVFFFTLETLPVPSPASSASSVRHVLPKLSVPSPAVPRPSSTLHAPHEADSRSSHSSSIQRATEESSPPALSPSASASLALPSSSPSSSPPSSSPSSISAASSMLRSLALTPSDASPSAAPSVQEDSPQPSVDSTAYNPKSLNPQLREAIGEKLKLLLDSEDVVYNATLIKDRSTYNNVHLPSYLTPWSDLAPTVVAECEKGEYITSSAWAQDCIANDRIIRETQLRFPPFVLRMPRFISARDRGWFVSQQVIKEFINSSLVCFQRPLPAGVLCPLLDSRISPDEVIVFWNDNFVTGRNLLMSNGAFGKYEGCSWSSKYDAYLKEYPSFATKTPKQWEKLAPMIVVQGWSFQHLIDGVLPRLMQAWEILQDDPNITVLVDYNLSRFPVVKKIWEHLLPVERLVVFQPDLIFQGKLWYQSCQSPPFHPYLWKKMRHLFGYEEIPFDERNTIVYLGRGKRNGEAFNGGRSVTNEDAFMERLESFVDQRNAARRAAGRTDFLEIVPFNHANYPTLNDTIKFFNKAKVLIGPHGGSFYNLLFTPSGTLTIEFMLMNSAWGPNFIIWEQATMLDHNYYLLASNTLGGNMEVNVDGIMEIFDREIPV